MEDLINLNGKIISANKNQLSFNNRAFKYGDSLFETLKVIDSNIVFLEDHYFRLMASMRMLRMEIPMDFNMSFFESEIKKCVSSNSITSARCRLSVWRAGGGRYNPDSNKIEYLEKISEDSGWIIKVISGEKEAELIFKGVLLAFKEINKPTVILDIGGGSIELILAGKDKILWKESRPTGMARIVNQFTISDPIQANEIEQIQAHFSNQHKETLSRSAKMNIQTLIGCSGAFDTVADIIDGAALGEKQRKTQNITIEDFYNVFTTLINSKRNERINMREMDMVRVDLIVPAVILIELLVRKIGIKEIIQTDFALREGALSEMQNNSN